MIMLEQQEQAKRFDDFVLLLHANPMTDEKARNHYMKAIEPQTTREQRVGSMQTDFDQLRALKAELEAEAK